MRVVPVVFRLDLREPEIGTFANRTHEWERAKRQCPPERQDGDVVRPDAKTRVWNRRRIQAAGSEGKRNGGFRQGNRMNIVEALNYHVFPSSSPLEGEDNATRFSYFTKNDLVACGGGGALSQRIQRRAIPPHPGPPPQGGREGDTKELSKSVHAIALPYRICGIHSH